MPTITELIAEIQSSDWERGKDVAKQLAEKLKEFETATQKSKDNLKQQAETILAVVSAEGEGFEERLNDAAKKIAKLSEANQDLSEKYQRQTQELTSIKQDNLLGEVREKSGVKTNVLKTLIKEEDRLEIEGDRVTVNGTEIKEWAKTNQPDFYVALFPKTHAEVDLPGGGSNTGDLPAGGSKETSFESNVIPPERLEKARAAIGAF